MSGQPNTILEDIGAEIGFHATVRLSVWRGKQWLYVPKEANADHEIAKVIGYPAFRKLVAAFPGERIAIPSIVPMWATEYSYKQARDALAAGSSWQEVADLIGVSPRQVHNIRRTLEEAGLLPTILPAARGND